MPKDKKKTFKIEKLLSHFKKEEERLLFDEKVCIPRKSVSTVLSIANDSKIGGQYKFSNTMSRPRNFHWKIKSRDVKRYNDGCIKCQQHKDSNQRKLTYPTPLKIPERRWESLAA